MRLCGFETGARTQRLMGQLSYTACKGRVPRHIAPKRVHVSRSRCTSLLLTACNLSQEVYQPTKTDADMYVSDLKADVRVNIGKRICGRTQYCTVAFSGTESLNDWLYNLMMWMVGQEYGIEGRVHAGFCSKWRAVRCKVINVLKKIGTTDILVTGHSLGGALATIASFDLARTLPDRRVFAYTFGAPRCADYKFHSSFPPRNLVHFVRCIHAGDFVHMFPPLPGYVHPHMADLLVVGQSAHTNRKVDLSENRGEWHTSALWQQLQRAWRTRLKLEHHRIFSYRRAIVLGDMGEIIPRSESLV